MQRAAGLKVCIRCRFRRPLAPVAAVLSTKDVPRDWALHLLLRFVAALTWPVSGLAPCLRRHRCNEAAGRASE